MSPSGVTPITMEQSHVDQTLKCTIDSQLSRFRVDRHTSNVQYVPPIFENLQIVPYLSLIPLFDARFNVNQMKRLSLRILHFRISSSTSLQHRRETPSCLFISSYSLLHTKHISTLPYAIVLAIPNDNILKYTLRGHLRPLEYLSVLGSSSGALGESRLPNQKCRGAPWVALGFLT